MNAFVLGLGVNQAIHHPHDKDHPEKPSRCDLCDDRYLIIPFIHHSLVYTYIYFVILSCWSKQQLCPIPGDIMPSGLVL